MCSGWINIFCQTSLFLEGKICFLYLQFKTRILLTRDWLLQPWCCSPAWFPPPLPHQHFVMNNSRHTEKLKEFYSENLYIYHQVPAISIILCFTFALSCICPSVHLPIHMCICFVRCISKWVSYMILNVFYPNTSASVFYSLIKTSGIDTSLK